MTNNSMPEPWEIRADPTFDSGYKIFDPDLSLWWPCDADGKFRPNQRFISRLSPKEKLTKAEIAYLMLTAGFVLGWIAASILHMTG